MKIMITSVKEYSENVIFIKWTYFNEFGIVLDVVQNLISKHVLDF